MTSDEKFISQFIDTCVQTGHASPAAMCDVAQSEIDAIDLQLKGLEPLRIRQNNLRQIIRQFGAEVTKKGKKAPMIAEPTLDHLDPQLEKICIKICNLIEQCLPEKLTIYQIKDAVVSLYDNKLGYTAIKSLYERGIVQRVEQGGAVWIVKGEQWQHRPTTVAVIENT